MKKPTDKGTQGRDGDMRREYRFDYAQARPNRFAGRIDPQQLVVLLDPDVSEVFSTPESVNTALRALITAMPKSTKPCKRV
jgi:hypothetical protein